MPVERAQRQRVSKPKPRPAPVRGWNAKDSITEMKPADAVILDNWFPSASNIMLRKGSAEHVTDIGGGTADVETLAAYRPGSGIEELFAWASTEAYEVSSAGAVGAAVIASLTHARWQTVNFRTTGGHFLLCVNGADEMQVYDGSTWETINGSSTPAITNVDTDDLINVHVHKERVWYIEINSMSVWYSAAGAFAGALDEFPLGSVFKKGGYLLAMGTWTIDGGDGADDLAVFITSEGEVAVYQGIDPASSSTWALIGIYAIGTPIGRRCMEQLGGDLLIITTDGVIPCSRLSIAKENKTVAMTDAIQTAMAQAVEFYGTTFGWQAKLYPGGTMLVLNVPVANALQQQFVMNTVTKRWCRFLPKRICPGWPAWCFEVFNGALYFGMRGEVRKAWTGTSDAGLPIVSEVLCAFDYFETANQKHFKMVQPIIGWDSNPAEILIGVDLDFIIGTPASQITLPASSGGVWDSGSWDGSTFGGDVSLTREWFGAEGTGIAGAFHMLITSTSANIRFSAINYLFEPGELL